MGKVVKRKDTQESLLGRRVCGTCYFWERHPDALQAPGEDITGDCCILPPTVLDVSEDGYVLQASPIVNFHDRCGQHCAVAN